jgi:hypothetical protein
VVGLSGDVAPDAADGFGLGEPFGDPALGRRRRRDQMLTLRQSESYSNGILKLVYDVKH